MIRMTLIAVITTACAVTAMAGPGGRHQEPDFERLAERLELEDSQVAEFTRIMEQQHEINRTRREAHRKLIEENGRSPELREQMHAQREQARQETLDAVSVILTPAQVSEFEQMMRKRGRKGHGPRKKGQEMEEI